MKTATISEMKIQMDTMKSQMDEMKEIMKEMKSQMDMMKEMKSQIDDIKKYQMYPQEITNDKIANTDFLRKRDEFEGMIIIDGHLLNDKETIHIYLEDQIKQGYYVNFDHKHDFNNEKDIRQYMEDKYPQYALPEKPIKPDLTERPKTPDLAAKPKKPNLTEKPKKPTWEELRKNLGKKSKANEQQKEKNHNKSHKRGGH